jgi:hypothetical protein
VIQRCLPQLNAIIIGWVEPAWAELGPPIDLDCLALLISIMA